MYRVVIKKTAARAFKSIRAKDRARILEAIDRVKMEPHNGKPLSGDLRGLWGARAWPYRIIYNISDKLLLIEVVDIGHRQNIYK